MIEQDITRIAYALEQIAELMRKRYHLELEHVSEEQREEKFVSDMEEYDEKKRKASEETQLRNVKKARLKVDMIKKIADLENTDEYEDDEATAEALAPLGHPELEPPAVVEDEEPVAEAPKRKAPKSPKKPTQISDEAEVNEDDFIPENVTREQVRQALMTAAGQIGQGAARQLLYDVGGADTLSGVPESEYGRVFRAALEAAGVKEKLKVR